MSIIFLSHVKEIYFISLINLFLLIDLNFTKPILTNYNQSVSRYYAVFVMFMNLDECYEWIS